MQYVLHLAGLMGIGGDQIIVIALLAVAIFQPGESGNWVED